MDDAKHYIPYRLGFSLRSVNVSLSGFEGKLCILITCNSVIVYAYSVCVLCCACFNCILMFSVLETNSQFMIIKPRNKK